MTSLRADVCEPIRMTVEQSECESRPDLRISIEPTYHTMSKMPSKDWKSSKDSKQLVDRQVILFGRKKAFLGLHKD